MDINEVQGVFPDLSRRRESKKSGPAGVGPLSPGHPNQGLLPVGNGHAACGLNDVFAGDIGAKAAAALFFAAGFLEDFFAVFLAGAFFAAFLAAAFFAAFLAGAFFAAFLVAAFLVAAFLTTAFLAGAFFAAAFLAGAFFAAAFLAGAFFIAAFLAGAFFAVAISFLLDQVAKRNCHATAGAGASQLFTAQSLPRRGAPVR